MATGCKNWAGAEKCGDILRCCQLRAMLASVKGPRYHLLPPLLCLLPIPLPLSSANLWGMG